MPAQALSPPTDVPTGKAHSCPPTLLGVPTTHTSRNTGAGRPAGGHGASQLGCWATPHHLERDFPRAATGVLGSEERSWWGVTEAESTHRQSCSRPAGGSASPARPSVPQPPAELTLTFSSVRPFSTESAPFWRMRCRKAYREERAVSGCRALRGGALRVPVRTHTVGGSQRPGPA